MLSDYQVVQLQHYCSICKVHKIGIIKETGEIILEYSNAFFKSDLKTVKIPKVKADNSEVAEFEIIQPKLLK